MLQYTMIIIKQKNQNKKQNGGIAGQVVKQLTHGKVVGGENAEVQLLWKTSSLKHYSKWSGIILLGMPSISQAAFDSHILSICLCV